MNFPFIFVHIVENISEYLLTIPYKTNEYKKIKTKLNEKLRLCLLLDLLKKVLIFPFWVAVVNKTDAPLRHHFM